MGKRDTSGSIVTIKSDEGFIQLVGAVLRQTSQDLKYGTKENRISAENFMTTNYFEDICIMFNCNPESMKEKLNKQVKWRCQYE